MLRQYSPPRFRYERIGAGRRVGQHHADCFVARGGHLAQVRDLATGRSMRLADHIIHNALDKSSYYSYISINLNGVS